MILNSKTYTFGGWVNGVTSYIERSLGIAALFSAVTASLKIDSMVRSTWKLNVPFPQPSEPECCGADPVAGFAEATIGIRMSPNLTSAQRADFLQRIQDLTETAEFIAAVTNLVAPTS